MKNLKVLVVLFLCLFLGACSSMLRPVAKETRVLTNQDFKSFDEVFNCAITFVDYENKSDTRYHFDGKKRIPIDKWQSNITKQDNILGLLELGNYDNPNTFKYALQVKIKDKNIHLTIKSALPYNAYDSESDKAVEKVAKNIVTCLLRK